LGEAVEGPAPGTYIIKENLYDFIRSLASLLKQAPYTAFPIAGETIELVASPVGIFTNRSAKTIEELYPEPPPKPGVYKIGTWERRENGVWTVNPFVSFHVTPLRNSSASLVHPEIHGSDYRPLFTSIWAWIEAIYEPERVTLPLNLGRDPHEAPSPEAPTRRPGGRAIYSLEKQDEIVEKWFTVSQRGGTSQEEFITQYPALTLKTFKGYITNYNKRHRQGASS
jgi:hypothetical protein